MSTFAACNFCHQLASPLALKDLKDKDKLAITREPKVFVLEQHAILMVTSTSL